MSMRIENEMLSRFNTSEASMASEISLSNELDFFFDNVMDTVVEYFTDATTGLENEGPLLKTEFALTVLLTLIVPE